MLKKTLALLSVSCLIIGVSTSAMAHCGSCGAGGKKVLKTQCKTQCKDSKDAACVQKCEAAHKKKDSQKAAEKPSEGCGGS